MNCPFRRPVEKLVDTDDTASHCYQFPIVSDGLADVKRDHPSLLPMVLWYITTGCFSCGFWMNEPAFFLFSVSAFHPVLIRDRKIGVRSCERIPWIFLT
ncbi:hypothetical protein CEXT_484771 [Caerostris extrusa]|uniref:Uncharacterized protein n=1 Tax=Caerostris extrusa TaxID=172846 RepID=A0AAV4Y2L8_CAEEX|nr:hypothetical protein CEXT_484771 [Caerostris extrusa]